MGCSASTEAGVRRGNVASSSSPGPTAPHPSDVEESNKPAPLLSTATSVKTDFNTSTTQASFFYGFKGGGRSSGSATGSDTQLASRSDAGFGSDLGSSSSRTSSGRRFGSASGGSSGEALLEKEEESDFEDDFEDADDDASPRGRWLRQEGARGRRDGDTGKKSEADDGVVVAKLEEIGTTLGGQTDDPLSGTAKEDRAIKAAEATASGAVAAGVSNTEEKSTQPRPPDRVEGTTGEKSPGSRACAEALAEAPAPASTVEVVQLLSSMSRDDHDSDGPLSGGPSSAGRGSRGVGLVTAASAKAEGPAIVPSPQTPRTESASPAAATPVSVRGSLRSVGGTPPRRAWGVCASSGPTSDTGAGKVAASVLVGSISLPKPEAPMLVLSLGALAAEESFPTYQSAMQSGVLVSCESLDRASAFVVFVSHRWIADGGDPGGGSSRRERGAVCGSVPDSGSAKHALVLEGLNALMLALPRGREVYLWMDCCCIDQYDTDSKRAAARSIAAYMQQCDAVLTPYLESLYPIREGDANSPGGENGSNVCGVEGDEGKGWLEVVSGGGGCGAGTGVRGTPGNEEGIGSASFVNPLGEAFCSAAGTRRERQAVGWPNSYRSLQDYCSRAWCRLEVLLCSSLSRTGGGFSFFGAQGQVERAQDRPHFLFGEHQRRRKLPPEPLPPAGVRGWASSLDPLKGSLTLPEDMESIVHAMATLRLPAVAPPAPALTPPTSTVGGAAVSLPISHTEDERRDSTRSGLSGGDRVEKSAEAGEDVESGGWVGGKTGGTARPGLWGPVGGGFGAGAGGAGDRKEGEGGGAGGVGGGGGLFGARTGRAARGETPPPIETRVLPGLTDERDVTWAGSGTPASERLMSPAVKGSKMMASPMRMRTAAASSAMGTAGEVTRADSSMPGWLWDTVFQYPLAEGDTRTQYSDGSTFVGPLKDGMRHGKGAYFFQDGSRYEGGFNEDKRHGEGTLILAGGGRYVGDWENDLQHGQGTFYFADGACFQGLWVQGKKKKGVFTYSSGGRYIGELQGGKRHGTGSFLYPDGSSYEGQWQENVKHGEGTAWYASGNRYVGQWRAGKSHGEGTYFYATGARYEGQFDNGKCQGRGSYYYANGNRYEGEWKDDMKWGFGTAVYRKKANYEGHFFMDKRHGFGRMWYANAGTYEGEWAAGKPHGQGTATHKDGEKYVGTYQAGLYHGEGCYWYTNGAVYEGEYRNGRVHGKGRATFPSGDSYAGEWREGAMSGTGVYDFKAEGASYEGDFRNGRMHGVGVYRWAHGDVYRGSWQADRRSGRGRYEWTELGLTFEGTFKDDRRMGRGSIIFPDNSRYQCQWENDKAMDSTADGARSVHYRADGTECTGDCDVRCREKGGDELRRLMRRINEQRMKQPVTPTVKPEGRADAPKSDDTPTNKAD